jgi:hypothetical protein
VRTIITLVARNRHRQEVARKDFSSCVEAANWMRDQHALDRKVRAIYPT